MQKRIHNGIHALKKNLMIDPHATDTVIVCSPATWQFLKKCAYQQEFPFYAAVYNPTFAKDGFDVLTIGGMKVVPDEKLAASQLLFRTESEIP